MVSWTICPFDLALISLTTSSIPPSSILCSSLDVGVKNLFRCFVVHAMGQVDNLDSYSHCFHDFYVRDHNWRGFDLSYFGRGPHSTHFCIYCLPGGSVASFYSMIFLHRLILNVAGWTFSGLFSGSSPVFHYRSIFVFCKI